MRRPERAAQPPVEVESAADQFLDAVLGWGAVAFLCGMVVLAAVVVGVQIGMGLR